MSEKVDVSKLREGDVVLVRGVIDKDGDIDLRISRNLAYRFIARDAFCTVDIAATEPRALKVGDRVKISGLIAEILAINGVYAWVGSNEAQHWTYRLSELERASQ